MPNKNNSKRRRFLFLLGASTAVILLLSPFIYHKFRFDRLYISNLARWHHLSNGNYDAVVLSNSIEYPTGGENRIRVRDGQLIEGTNSNCGTCTLADYLPLSIEALFDRIDKECIRMTLLPICNIVYDETLGYPKRIDTYTFHEDGTHEPSITITEVHIVELE